MCVSTSNQQHGQGELLDRDSKKAKTFTDTAEELLWYYRTAAVFSEINIDKKTTTFILLLQEML